MPKYELTDNTIEVPYKDGNHTLYQIRALRDIHAIPSNPCKVLKGQFGGFVEGEHNLVQDDDNAWIYDYARVFGQARISGNARVAERAIVYDSAQAWDDATVKGFAQVYGYARILGRALVMGSARVCANAKILDWARVRECAIISGKANVEGFADLRGSSKASDNACVTNGVFRAEHITDSEQVLFFSHCPFHDINATPTHFRIGCKTLPWKEYTEQFESLLAENNANPREADYYRLIFATAKKFFGIGDYIQ
jgi:carbonic anhydrase/acetyltransferase-like protein (isoleucine patch superfamily)